MLACNLGLERSGAKHTLDVGYFFLIFLIFYSTINLYEEKAVTMIHPSR